jgi:hypothetical protein
MGDTLVLGPRTVSEFRIQYQRAEDGNVPDFPGSPEIQRPSSISGPSASAPATWGENKISISESITHNFNWAGSHSIKFGTQDQFVRGNAYIATFFQGQYIFSTDLPFNANNPVTYPVQYTYASGNATAPMGNNIVSFHFNDEWRPVSRLSVNLGVRYDLERGPVVNVFPSRNANFAPRLSFAWTPFKDRKTVIRGGFGQFYMREYGNLGVNLYNIGAPPPFGVGTVSVLTITNPGYPDPFGPNPNNKGGSSPPLKAGAFSDHTEKTPFSNQASFGIQREFGGGVALTVDFVQVLGEHMPEIFDHNAPDSQGIRPIVGWGELYSYQSSGRTWYDAMHLTLEKRFSHGNQVLVSYTWSKTEDTLWPLYVNQSGAGPQCWCNTAAEKAVSASSGSNAAYFLPNYLKVSGVQHLPFGLLGSTVFTYFSPQRYNITTGRANDAGILSLRPNWVPTNTGNARYVDPGVAPNVQGNLGRNAGIFGGGYASLDLRVSKTLKFRERYSVALLMEGFNVTNRTNYSGYQGNLRSAIFGKPTAAYDPRQLQFGAKFDF